MKKTRKIVIVITFVLAVAGIASVVTGAIVKKNTSGAKYMDTSNVYEISRETFK